MMNKCTTEYSIRHWLPCLVPSWVQKISGTWVAIGSGIWLLARLSRVEYRNNVSHFMIMLTAMNHLTVLGPQVGGDGLYCLPLNSKVSVGGEARLMVISAKYKM